MMKIPVLIVVGLVSVAGAMHLERRAGQSLAVCQPSFSWADNSEQLSPCQLVANLDALCNDGSWIIDALNASVNYPDPGVKPGTNTFCTCSWASYNLLGACTACQGFPEKISSWDQYSLQCTGMLSDTYFPPNITLPDGTGIPFWAIQNPTSWTNHRFDPTTAQSIAAQAHPDVVGQPASKKKSTPVGAIVGGVIGGLIILVATVLIAVYIIRRNKTKTVPPHHGNGHMRSESEATVKSNGFSLNYSSLPSTTPMMTTTPSSPGPTIFTHGGSSIRSMPFSSMMGSSIPHTVSPPLPSNSPPPAPLPREAVIEPFTLPPSVPDPDRKSPNGPVTTYDSPSAPPAGLSRGESYTPQTPAQNRTRYNPPAYEAVSPDQSGSGTPGSTSRRPHAKKGSADTHESTSTRSAGAARYPGGYAPAPSIPATSPSNLSREDTMYTRTERSEDEAVPPVYSQGREPPPPRDQKRRQQDDDFNGRDLA